MTDIVKSFFSFFSTDLDKEEQKAKDNLAKITMECEEKKKVALSTVTEVTAKKAAKEAEEKVKAAGETVTRGGKSRRKGTRKPKGKKNKKTRRN